MPSKIELINSALILVGDKPLNSLTETRRAAVAANQLYDSVFESEITRHRWGFARTTQELNRLVGQPEIDIYRYKYQLPADMLVAVRIYPNAFDFKIYGKELWVNNNQVTLDYIRKVTEAELPAYFVELMEYALAMKLSIAIRDETDRYQLMAQSYTVSGRNARFQDSQQHPQDPIQDNPTIVSRF